MKPQGIMQHKTTYDGNTQGNQILYKDKEDEKSKQRQLLTNADATYT
ncbi:MAG: hypothetical protein IPO27_14740 [Bacteroidetes bacterium]|nr:hypothetical protein [Bacteroidota bacterium]